MNGLPFLVYSTIGLNNVCKSGQNNDKQFTTPQKLLHCLGIFGVGILLIALVLDLNGLSLFSCLC